MSKTLAGRVALVSGATRGAGRGIACMLGEKGATVYCTGRSTRASRSAIQRPETIEQTAEMVTARGGIGKWMRIDHTDPEQVSHLIDRIRTDEGRLDLLINDMSGDQFLTSGMLSGSHPISFWRYPLQESLAVQRNGVHTHLITCWCAIPLLIGSGGGLIVEVTDGNLLYYNDVGVAYSLAKTSLITLAYLLSEELRTENVAVVSLSPGWLRSEKMLDRFGVSESNWRDAIQESPEFSKSESPFYIGRAVCALAADPTIMRKTGHSLSAGHLAREYGFTDIDGTQPPGYDGHTETSLVEGVFRNGRFRSLTDA